MTDKYNDIKEKMDRHEEEGNARLEAENAEEGDPEKWDKKVQRAEAACEKAHERIAEQRAELDDKAAEFEEKVKYEDEQAEKRGEEFKERMVARAEKAEADKVAALEKAEVDKEACIELNK